MGVFNTVRHMLEDYPTLADVGYKQWQTYLDGADQQGGQPLDGLTPRQSRHATACLGTQPSKDKVTTAAKLHV